MLDKKDIADLETAKENGLNLDQIIESAKNIVTQNELKQNLNRFGNQIFQKFGKVLEDNIEKISQMETNGEMLDFITKDSIRLYEEERILREKKEAARIKEIEEHKLAEEIK